MTEFEECIEELLEELERLVTTKDPSCVHSFYD